MTTQRNGILAHIRHYLECLILAVLILNHWTGYLAAIAGGFLAKSVWGTSLALALWIAFAILLYTAWMKCVLLPKLDADHGVRWFVQFLIVAFLLLAGGLVTHAAEPLSAVLIAIAISVPLYQLQVEEKWTRIIDPWSGGW